MKTSKTTVIFLSLALLNWDDLVTASTGKTVQFHKSIPESNFTSTSLDIDTNEVKKTPYPPLIVLENGFEIVDLINTGYSVELRLVNRRSANIVIGLGGLQGLNTYVFIRTEFYWSDGPNGAAYTTIDGKHGTALEIHLIYYNVKYESFKNAMNFADGLVILSFRIKVGLVDNPLFDVFVPYLKHVQKAGSSVRMVLIPAYLFYSFTPPASPYYAYRGSYTDKSTGITHNCATIIVTPAYSFHFISFEQFKIFSSFHGHDGKSYVNQAKRVPQGNTTVLQSLGILKILNFIKIPARN